MSVSLMMGWVLLGLLSVLVVALFLIVLISGLSGKRSGGGLPPGPGTRQVTPGNVFQHQVTAPVSAPAGAPAPAQWAAPAGAPAPAQWAAPAGAPAPAQWAAPAGAPGPDGLSAAPRLGGAADLRRWYPGMGATRAPMDQG